MKIAHIELGRHIYGGAAQVQYLLEGLVDDHHEHVLVAARGGEMAAWAARAGQACFELALSGEQDLAAIRRLWRWLREQRIDLIHVHSRRGADWMGPLAGWLAQVPAILTRRVDNPPRGWLQWLMRRRYRRVVCISSAIHKIVAELGVADDKLLTIASAVDTARIDAAEPVALSSIIPNLAPGAPVIGVIAQLIERKGHRHLLRVLPGLRDRFPDLQVVFFGRGPLREQLGAEVDAAGLSSAVHFAGFRDDLAGALGELALVVHPALAEGLGVCLLEAAAAGVPVVAFAVGGVPQAVADEHSGLLVKPGDSIGLAASIGRLLGDDALRARMGAQARRRVETEFSVGTMVQRHAALYDVLAGEME